MRAPLPWKANIPLQNDNATELYTEKWLQRSNLRSVYFTPFPPPNTHTCTCAHTYAHAHTHTYIWIYVHVRTHAHMYARTHNPPGPCWHTGCEFVTSPAAGKSCIVEDVNRQRWLCDLAEQKSYESQATPWNVTSGCLGVGPRPQY